MQIIADTYAIYMAEIQKKPTWELIIGELVDNAIDASATTIDILLDNDMFLIKDNGVGCNDLTLILAMGSRRNHVSTSIGRYGVGAKSAIVGAGMKSVVSSVCRGFLSTTRVSWLDAKPGPGGSIETNNEILVQETSMPQGTKIVVRDLKRRPNRRTIDAIREFLSITYRVGLLKGISITLTHRGRKEKIKPFDVPTLAETIEGTFDVYGSKANVRIGLVEPGQPCRECNMFVEYGYRTIARNSRIGLGDHPVSGLVGWIVLDNSWPLKTYKDGISDEKYEDELDRQIYHWAKPLIDKARNRTKTLQFGEIENLFNEHVLPDVLGYPDRKAKRSAHENETGGVTPTGNGSPHRRAARTQAGSRFGGRNKSRLLVQFENIGDDKKLFDVRSNIIRLNSAHLEFQEHANNYDMIKRHVAHIIGSYSSMNPEEVDRGTLFDNGDVQRRIDRHAEVTSKIIASIAKFQPVLVS